MFRWVPKWWLVAAAIVILVSVSYAVFGASGAETWRRWVYASPALAMLVCCPIIAISRRSKNDPPRH